MEQALTHAVLKAKQRERRAGSRKRRGCGRTGRSVGSGGPKARATTTCGSSSSGSGSTRPVRTRRRFRMQPPPNGRLRGILPEGRGPRCRPAHLRCDLGQLLGAYPGAPAQQVCLHPHLEVPPRGEGIRGLGASLLSSCGPRFRGGGGDLGDDCIFQSKVGTDSGTKWAAIPVADRPRRRPDPRQSGGGRPALRIAPLVGVVQGTDPRYSPWS